FHQELTDDAGLACAEGRANGKFLGAAGGTSEEEVGHVQAGDQENEADGAEEHEQESLYAAEIPLAERNEGGGDVFIGVRIGGGKILGDALHVRAGLIDGDAGFEASNGADTESGIAIHEQGIAPLADGDVKIGRVEIPEKIER